MKFVYHLGLAALFGSFAVAVPANSLVLSLTLKDGDVPRHYGDKITPNYDICQGICHLQQPKCDDKWVSTRHAGWFRKIRKRAHSCLFNQVLRTKEWRKSIFCFWCLIIRSWHSASALLDMLSMFLCFWAPRACSSSCSAAQQRCGQGRSIPTTTCLLVHMCTRVNQMSRRLGRCTSFLFVVCCILFSSPSPSTISKLTQTLLNYSIAWPRG